MRSAACLLVMGLILAAPAAADPVTNLSPAELDAKVKADDSLLIIDVRTPAEYAAGHVPGAINIYFEEIGARIAEIDAPNGVAIYCGVGPRARKAEAALVEAGYRGPVHHLEGGFTAWRSSGLPVTSRP